MIAVFATCILLTIFQELEALDFNLLGYEIKRDGKKLSNDENSLLDIIMNDPKLERLEDFENEVNIEKYLNYIQNSLNFFFYKSTAHKIDDIIQIYQVLYKI